jgi:hypothetical protein
MTDGLDARANVTLSGRELAMQRRQAMARLGKVGAGKTAAAGKSVAVARTAAHVVPAQIVPAAGTTQAAGQSAIATAPAPAVKPARARREALSRVGKSALPAAQPHSSARRPTAMANAPVAVATTAAAAAARAAQDTDHLVQAASAPAVAPDTGVRAAATPSGRALAQARRSVLAKEGKSGLKRVAQAVKIAAALPEQNWQAAISQGATGRQIAMQHRLVRSLAGRAGDGNATTTTRPTGRIRPTVAKGEAPVKVEEGHTLAGQRVTGTLIERSKLVTGNEPGATRAITGTEYIGAEQFERSGVVRPQGAPAKVSVSETAKGMSVTGALVGRSPKVTGDEVGATRTLTGTAYLGSAQPGAAPEKVILTHTAQGKPVTGTSVGGGKLTGDERGMCARITGTEYLAAETVRSECQVEPAARPSKVTVSTTLGSQPVSGAGVGRSSKVTGDEPGACRSITGSQYYNTNDFAALCATPSPRRAVSVMSRPAHTAEATFPKSVGDAGLEAACATAFPSVHPFGLNLRDASTVRPAVAIIPALAVTGDRPGSGGAVMTGDERGACLCVSGTPYLGEDNAPLDCPTPASGRFLDRARPAEREERVPAPLDFSVRTPAREAWERRGSAITGASMGEERITGPIAKAGGLITGTPDFRHRTVARQQDVPAAARLSGEGAQAGTRITGDAWQAKSRVTGTEGASALLRNPSQRGEPRGVGVVGAREFRDIERQPVPESRVTGSSGNTLRGALVTVSGGARA